MSKLSGYSYPGYDTAIASGSGLNSNLYNDVTAVHENDHSYFTQAIGTGKINMLTKKDANNYGKSGLAPYIVLELGLKDGEFVEINLNNTLHTIVGNVCE
jgi:hypothetical protein